MTYIKTKEEVTLITEGGRLMGEILEKLVAMVRPGISTAEIDRAAETMIRAVGGQPAFKGYQPHGIQVPFPATICASVNHELVHGIPSAKKILRDGDIFTIDIGMEWPNQTSDFRLQTSDNGMKALSQNSPRSEVRGPKSAHGYFTDTAVTVAVGEIPEKTKKLLEVTRQALEVGIEQCRPGNTIADIGRAIEAYVQSQGPYGIVRDLVGHGVGHAVHEEPRVPNYYERELKVWKLQPGVVIAIEPMITLGSHRVQTATDHWTIATVDKSLCAHFEHTIIITEEGSVVATRRPHE